MAETPQGPAQLQSLRDVFVQELRGVYDAERQLQEILPMLSEASRSDRLTAALNDHLNETHEHVARLQDVFRALGVDPDGASPQGIRGIVTDGLRLIDTVPAGAVRDAAIIAAAQRVEHHETAIYGTLVTWANELEQDEIADLLHRTLHQELEADRRLTAIARGGINRAASSGAGAEPEADLSGTGTQQAHTAIGRTTRRDSPARVKGY